MADFNVGGSIGYENERFFDEVGYPDVFSCDELIPDSTDPKQNPQQVFDLSAGTNELFSSLSTNEGGQAGSGGARLWCLQEQFHQPLGRNELLPDSLLPSTINQGRLASLGAQPWLRQQLGQPPVPNRCLPEPWINQGQGIQAAAATESLIAQQHSGQSSVPFTGDPCSQRNIVKISALDSLVKKRRYDKTYREKVKKQKQDLVYENGRLKLEIEGKRQQMKSELEASEVENGRLKFKMEECEAENGRLEFKLEAFEAENGRLKSKLEEFEAENGRLKSKLEAFEAENGKLKHEIQGKEEQMKSKLEASEAENGRLKSKLEEFEAENGRLKHEIQVKEQQKFNLDTEFKRLWDEVNSLKRDNACVNQRMQTQSTELVQLRNKFELEQQNQRTKRKRSMSSIQEFGPQTTENDSVDSAKTFPTIRSAKMRRPARKRVESFSDQLKALAVAAQTSERGAQGEAVESQRLGRESRRLRSEALGNIDPANVLKIRPNQTVELVGPIHESNNGQGRVVEVERLNSQVRGTIDPPNNNALIVNVLKTGPDLDG